MKLSLSFLLFGLLSAGAQSESEFHQLEIRCSLECHNGGTCSFGYPKGEAGDDFFPSHADSADSGMYCQCLPEWDGALCDNQVLHEGNAGNVVIVGDPARDRYPETGDDALMVLWSGRDQVDDDSTGFSLALQNGQVAKAEDTVLDSVGNDVQEGDDAALSAPVLETADEGSSLDDDFWNDFTGGDDFWLKMLSAGYNSDPQESDDGSGHDYFISHEGDDSASSDPADAVSDKDDPSGTVILAENGEDSSNTVAISHQDDGDDSTSSVPNVVVPDKEQASNGIVILAENGDDSSDTVVISHQGDDGDSSTVPNVVVAVPEKDDSAGVVILAENGGDTQASTIAISHEGNDGDSSFVSSVIVLDKDESSGVVVLAEEEGGDNQAPNIVIPHQGNDDSTRPVPTVIVNTVKDDETDGSSSIVILGNAGSRDSSHIIVPQGNDHQHASSDGSRGTDITIHADDDSTRGGSNIVIPGSNKQGDGYSSQTGQSIIIPAKDDDGSAYDQSLIIPGKQGEGEDGSSGRPNSHKQDHSIVIPSKDDDNTYHDAGKSHSYFPKSNDDEANDDSKVVIPGSDGADHHGHHQVIVPGSSDDNDSSNKHIVIGGDDDSYSHPSLKQGWSGSEIALFLLSLSMVTVFAGMFTLRFVAIRRRRAAVEATHNGNIWISRDGYSDGANYTDEPTQTGSTLAQDSIQDANRTHAGTRQASSQPIPNPEFQDEFAEYGEYTEYSFDDGDKKAGSLEMC